MKTPNDYIQKNKDSWNKRTPEHIKSSFYDVEGFLSGKSSLKNIELELLGQVSGKKILHLQCHFGQDSLSLSRMGAKVTGVDFSEKAIEQAQLLNQNLNLDAKFICCDVYDLPNHLDDQFDIVYTTYGVIGWLPNLNKWASVISRFLKPNGKLIFVEFHPVVWMYDNDFSKVSYSYFKTEPIIEHETGTYTDRSAPIEHTDITWNHSLSEVLNSLIQNGLKIENFNEYNYSPYNCFNHTEKLEEDYFIIKHLGENIPMVYSLIANKEKK